MTKRQDRETRYFIDVDVRTMSIIDRDQGPRRELASEKPDKPHYHRIYLTKGQFNKLQQKIGEFGK